MVPSRDMLLAGIALAALGIAQAYALYRLADAIERRDRTPGRLLRPALLVAGLACLWPEVTGIGDRLLALRPGSEAGELVWALVLGSWLGTLLPRPPRSRTLPRDASLDEIESD